MNGEVFFIYIRITSSPLLLLFSSPQCCCLFGLPAVCFFEAMTLVRHSYGTFVMQVIFDFGTEEPVNFQQIRPEKKRHKE
jgi:hypothetical protein